MTIQASHFTPEVMLSAPRRSPGVPNSSGTWILYTVSAYSFETHTKTSQIRVLSYPDKNSHLVSEDPEAQEPVWISEDEIAFLKPNKCGAISLMTQKVLDPESCRQVQLFYSGSISNLKVKQISPDRAYLCCSAVTTPSGEMYWPDDDPKTYSSAKIYTSLFARHWDAWSTENYNSLWFGVLSRPGREWTLETPLINILLGTNLSSPVGPFGGTGDFDVSESGIVFVAKDPELDPARYTKTDLYHIPIQEDGILAKRPKRPRPCRIETPGLQGYSAHPVFSRDGRKIAFTRMKSDQYESDRPRLLVIPDVGHLSSVAELYQDGWDLRPECIVWSDDGTTLFVVADKHGRMVLWRVPVEARSKEPQAVFEKGSVVEARPLGPNGRLLVSSRSRIETSCYSILNPTKMELSEFSSSSKNGRTLGLSESQCSDMWFEGAQGRPLHALVTKPSDFDKSRKYPLAMLIHGGPQSAWMDDWSVRWNPAIFAEQGYVVVSPNPTGSTGYGQDLVDAIAENWGGDPYKDLVECFEHLEKEVDYVDTERAVALGASYGGYMINWIQGHPLGRRFKALVCHDGVFSTLSQWSTEELFFPEHDFGGTLWGNRKGYEQWDPASWTDKWQTPELVIHNELDYRLPVSEGLAAFNVLQARGVPSKLVVFPDENHWVLKPENSLVWYREVLQWINHYSGVETDSSLASSMERLTNA